MAPHCDTMDGPVVKAAELAIETENINYILPFVALEYDEELRKAFRRTLRVREESADAAELADRWFFETAVRLHRMGEGKPYTGLKPAGLDWGPVVPRAENALKTGDLDDLKNFVLKAVSEALEWRFKSAVSQKDYKLNDVDAARAYVNAMLNFVLFSNELYIYVEGVSEEEEDVE
jgi:hypothetical protein